MPNHRIARENAALSAVARVLDGVLTEIGLIPVACQRPQLVAAALSSARIVDDPESMAVAPAAFERLAVQLDELHDEEVRNLAASARAHAPRAAHP